MQDATSIISLRQPGSVEDPLTEIGREGVRRMLATAREAEIDACLDGFAEARLVDGRQRVVRHGHGPERKVQTGIGALERRCSKVRDRAADVASGEPIRLTSHSLAKGARRSLGLDALLPVLHLRGISTSAFQDALAALLGADAPNLSPGVIARLTVEWQAACILVIIGATAAGRKELVGFYVGTRACGDAGMWGRGRAPSAGASAWSTSKPAASPSRPRSPWATARAASGRRWTRSSRPRTTSAAGGTRSPTYGTRYGKAQLASAMDR